jgi:uncharacterized protein (TIGR02145 family)
MNNYISISKLLIFNTLLLFITSLNSCIKNQTVPTIETVGYSKLTSQSLSVQVKLNNPSNLSITEKGVAWFTISGLEPNGTPAFRTLENSTLNTFNSVVLNLQPNTTYYLKSYFLDNNGYHYGNEISITTPPSETSQFNSSKNYGIVSDVDGNQYKTIEIGNQTWMAENLKVSKFNDGTVISEIQFPWAFSNLGESHWCYFNDSSIYENPYGKFYNLIVVTNTKNICPTGWHVPTNQEILELNSNISTYNNVGALKSTGYIYWNSPNSSATNETGFSAIGSGERGYNGNTSLKNEFKFWTKDNSYAAVDLGSGGVENPALYLIYDVNAYNNGYSIRCVKD